MMPAHILYSSGRDIFNHLQNERKAIYDIIAYRATYRIYVN